MNRLGTTKLALVGAALIGAGLVSIALSPSRDGGPGAVEVFCVGYMFGSIFGHSVAASAWTVFGPGPVYVRLPLAILWCVLIWSALALNLLIYSGPPPEILWVVAACIAGIWLIVQTPYWLLCGFGNLKLIRSGETPQAAGAPPQYGIGQLLIFTSIVAVIFGAGRVAFSLFPSIRGYTDQHEVMIFAFLSAAAVLISLPLVPAVLLPRFSLPAVIFCLLLTAAATWIEYPLSMQAMGRAGGPQFMHFVWINAANAFWIVAFGLAVRLGGYQLTPSAPSASTITPTR